jgi:hypothetical protein
MIYIFVSQTLCKKEFQSKNDTKTYHNHEEQWKEKFQGKIVHSLMNWSLISLTIYFQTVKDVHQQTID